MAGLDAITALMRTLPSESAHAMALRALRLGAPLLRPAPTSPRLEVNLWGLRFPNPVGVAAGFDKNAEAPDAILRLGAGFVEIGAVTPLPQTGNPRPRLFRLAEDGAVINRMGFNNDGLDLIAKRLALRAGRPGIVGANLGANKESPDRMADYVEGVRGLWGLVDFFTINVSSPNTENLRALQGRDALSQLLGRVVAARDAMAKEKGGWAPVLVKIAPDLNSAEIGDVAEAALGVKLDGAIVSNTTLARPETLRSAHCAEKGGLSGAPLFERSTAALKEMAQATRGALPLIGVGGVGSAEQAYAKIRAGASLVQLYTALVYQGPGLIRRAVAGLDALLARDGFGSVAEAVGADL